MKSPRIKYYGLNDMGTVLHIDRSAEEERAGWRWRSTWCGKGYSIRVRPQLVNKGARKCKRCVETRNKWYKAKEPKPPKPPPPSLEERAASLAARVAQAKNGSLFDETEEGKLLKRIENARSNT